jgi:hypothetical protein
MEDQERSGFKGILSQCQQGSRLEACLFLKSGQAHSFPTWMLKSKKQFTPSELLIYNMRWNTGIYF